jgi:hypothetical protein
MRVSHSNFQTLLLNQYKTANLVVAANRRNQIVAVSANVTVFSNMMSINLIMTSYPILETVTSKSYIETRSKSFTAESRMQKKMDTKISKRSCSITKMATCTVLLV